MRSFKTFITERVRYNTYEEIKDAVDAYKKAGEILNPVYIDLVSQAKRVMNTKQMAKPDSILDLLRDHRDDADLSELYYTSFDGFTSHNKIEKLVAKLEKKKVPAYSKMIKDVKEYLKAWKPIGEDLKALKSKVVKVTQKRAEAKAVATTALERKFADSSSLIKIFESHMQEYKDMAEKRAREFIKERLDFLKKHDMDLDKAVPRTKNYNDYKTVEAKRAVYRSITKAKDDNVRIGKGDVRVPHPEMIERYVKMNVQAAEDAYRGFMEKMIQKIGKPVVKATMTGNIWTNATLRVTTNDNEEQVWNTNMIINFSKYQTMFNQFPSRRKK
jgi:hypothetical protein